MIESNCLRGTIGEFSLADIIQLISMGGKSGRLVLFDKSFGEGSIYFEHGYIVHADLNGHEGEDAARSLITLNAGIFKFTAGKEFRKRTMMVTGYELLMRVAQKADEDASAEHNGQLELEIESSSGGGTTRTRERIKDVLRARLGRRSRQPVAAVEASEGNIDALIAVCERIEQYIALFIDDVVARETGKEMREVTDQS